MESMLFYPEGKCLCTQKRIDNECGEPFDLIRKTTKLSSNTQVKSNQPAQSVPSCTISKSNWHMKLYQSRDIVESKREDCSQGAKLCNTKSSINGYYSKETLAQLRRTLKSKGKKGQAFLMKAMMTVCKKDGKCKRLLQIQSRSNQLHSCKPIYCDPSFID